MAKPLPVPDEAPQAIRSTPHVSLVRELMGPTDSRKAAKGTIRGDFGKDTMVNVAHGSDSPENAGVNAGEISSKIGRRVITLYGGSMNPQNCQAFFAQENIDGGLIGQASLDAKTFQQLIPSCSCYLSCHHVSQHRQTKR